MKYYLLLSVLLFFNISFSQDSIPSPSKQGEFKSCTLEETPIYPGCKRKKTEVKRKKCMSDKVSRFIEKNYDISIFNKLDLPINKYTVTIIFKLDKQGDVVEARANGPHYLLEKEAIRVINKLPQVIPGKINSQPVIIPFAIPIYLSRNK